MLKFLPLLLLAACTPKDEEISYQEYLLVHNCSVTNDGITAVCNDPFYRWVAPVKD